MLVQLGTVVAKRRVLVTCPELGLSEGREVHRAARTGQSRVVVRTRDTNCLRRRQLHIIDAYASDNYGNRRSDAAWPG